MCTEVTQVIFTLKWVKHVYLIAYLNGTRLILRAQEDRSTDWVQPQSLSYHTEERNPAHIRLCHKQEIDIYCQATKTWDIFVIMALHSLT